MEYYLSFELECKKQKKHKKEAGLAHFKSKIDK